MQGKMGVLKLLRENGNATDVFHVVSQLARKSGDDRITKERLKEARGQEKRNLRKKGNSRVKGG